jgi:hypothetical protein
MMSVDAIANIITTDTTTWTTLGSFMKTYNQISDIIQTNPRRR